MTTTLYKFGNNVMGELQKPYMIVYDSAFGVLSSMALDATGADGLISNVAGMAGLSGQREAQLAAGLTYGSIAALERATMRTFPGMMAMGY